MPSVLQHSILEMVFSSSVLTPVRELSRPEFFCGFGSAHPPFNSHHHSRHGNPKIPRQKTAAKIPLPWGAENSKNFWWGGLRNIAGFAAPSARWLRLRSATRRVIERTGDLAYGCVINHPVANSVGISATPP